MSIKTVLKAAKGALEAQDYQEAVTQAQRVLDQDAQNYLGYVFLGRGLEKQGRLQAAAKAYKTAVNVKPSEDLAWKGLCNIVESQPFGRIDDYHHAAIGLAKVYAEKGDADQCQTVVEKFIAFTKEHGSRPEYKKALEILLPNSSVYDCIEGRIPKPVDTYTKLAEITEVEEQERVNREIGERRTRLGANLSQVTRDVKREVFNQSSLEALYQSIIDWSSDDEVRRIYEEKLLQRAYDHLVVLLPEDKAVKRHQALKLAHDMIIIKHPFKLAWDLELEWKDVENLEELDRNVMLEYVTFFPESGLSQVIQSHLGVRRLQAGKPEASIDGAAEPNDEWKVITSEERLLLISEGLEDSKTSAFAHRVTGEFYLDLEEYESCVDACRKCQNLLRLATQKSGLDFQNNVDSNNLNLARSLVYYQSPKNHPEAKMLFEEILKRRPNSTAALLGIGLLLEEQEENEHALTFFESALNRDSKNVRIEVEMAWCKALTGNIEEGLGDLEKCLVNIETGSKRERELKAKTYYRIGQCIWSLHPDRASRKDRGGAYARFLSAIKVDPGFASAYTSLGIYYEDYAKDKKRARQCFQKAFELSGTEVVAAERLAQAFANDNEWDVVEIIAGRVIDSGIAKPSPGSKRKGLSWPFSSLGVVQMNRQDYARSVVSFQSALRISPADYNAWVGLGESYHSSGRYNAAKRALEHAQNLEDKSDDSTVTWFAQYLLSNVQRELGEYEEALAGYNCVLKLRPEEFGVSIAFLQTLIESAWHSFETGFYMVAAECAREAILRARAMGVAGRHAFNYWKAIGDACAILSWIPDHVELFPLNEMQHLLQDVHDLEAVTQSRPVNEVLSDVAEVAKSPSRNSYLYQSLLHSIDAYKHAIIASSSDIHARAVAWYNLGWSEYRVHTCCASGPLQEHKAAHSAKTAVRSFKKAIELEAGNADFWDALGVATTQLNPKVAQHAFVRSLNLNERSPRAWANLGVLCLLQGDHELAHSAFVRAQSTDPDYAHAWLGEGLIALLIGDTKEALSHFTHAIDIADASSIPVKSRYVLSAFDHILTSSNIRNELADLLQSIFAAQQLQAGMIPYRHLMALLQERVGDYEAAVVHLTAVCADAELRYEELESEQILGQFAHAKSDLARVQFAVTDYMSAVANADTALDLTTEEDVRALSTYQRQKIRLSAHLTAGLAHYHLSNMDQAVDMLCTAVDESGNAPDAICMLAQLLWAKNSGLGEPMAREHLLQSIEKHPGHIRSTLMLGTMSSIDRDEATLEAVVADLEIFQTSEEVTSEQQRQIAAFLATLARVLPGTSDQDLQEVAGIIDSIAMFPSHPHGWATLADVTADPYAAEMAVQTALQGVPPRGDLCAEELCKMFAGMATTASAQRSVALCPWLKDGWYDLRDCFDPPEVQSCA